MSKKKLICALVAAAIILAGSTTAFALDGGLKDGIKAARESLKQNIESFQAKNGTVKDAMKNKISEAGFVKVDKASAVPHLQSLKAIKEDINKIKEQISSAKSANDIKKAAELKTQLLDKISEAANAAKALVPYREQIKLNKAAKGKLLPLKEELLTIKNEMAGIREQNASIRGQIGQLKEQLKAAPKENTEQITNIADQITQQLNKLNDNITKMNALKDKAVNTINNYKF